MTHTHTHADRQTHTHTEDSEALNEAFGWKHLNEKKGSSQCVYFDERQREWRVGGWGEVGVGGQKWTDERWDEEEKYFRHGYPFRYKNRIGKIAAQVVLRFGPGEEIQTSCSRCSTNTVRDCWETHSGVRIYFKFCHHVWDEDKAWNNWALPDDK